MGRVAEDCVIPSSACFGGYISIAEMYLCESCVCFHIVHTVYNTSGFAHAIMLITQTCTFGNPKKKIIKKCVTDVLKLPLTMLKSF